jgi:hypothetical protein
MRAWLLRVCAVAAAGSVLSITASAAAVEAPTAYRAKVNLICRAYTPQLGRLNRRMKRAALAKNYGAALDALRRSLKLTLAEDSRIKRVHSPEPFRPRILPTLKLITQRDGHIGRALRAHTGIEFLGEITKLDQLDARLARRFDQLGLVECGSKQALT